MFHHSCYICLPLRILYSSLSASEHSQCRLVQNPHVMSCQSRDDVVFLAEEVDSINSIYIFLLHIKNIHKFCYI